MSKRSSSEKYPTPRCGHDATSGSPPACSTRCASHALHAYDRIIGLDLSEVALDGSLHKAPCGGEGTGKNPTDRAKLGWKWSIATDAHGIPIGWAIDGANRNDVKMLDPTLDDLARAGLLEEIETLHLDRGYDYPKVRAQLAGRGLDDLNIQLRSRPGAATTVKQPMRLGLRWVVEGTNSWLEQLRPAPSQHRPANPTPPCSALPGRRPAHHRQAHRLARPVEPRFTAYPLVPLEFEIPKDSVVILRWTAPVLASGRGWWKNLGLYEGSSEK